jgi:hypothetical protein
MLYQSQMCQITRNKPTSFIENNLRRTIDIKLETAQNRVCETFRIVEVWQFFFWIVHLKDVSQ